MTFWFQMVLLAGFSLNSQDITYFLIYFIDLDLFLDNLLISSFGEMAECSWGDELGW